MLLLLQTASMTRVEFDVSLTAEINVYNGNRSSSTKTDISTTVAKATIRHLFIEWVGMFGARCCILGDTTIENREGDPSRQGQTNSFIVIYTEGTRIIVLSVLAVWWFLFLQLTMLTLASHIVTGTQVGMSHSVK